MTWRFDLSSMSHVLLYVDACHHSFLANVMGTRCTERFT